MAYLQKNIAENEDKSRKGNLLTNTYRATAENKNRIEIIRRKNRFL